MCRLQQLDERRRLRDVLELQRARANERGFERLVHAMVDRLAFTRTDAAEAHRRRQCAAQPEVKKRSKRFVARHTERAGHEAKSRREMTVELVARQPCACVDEQLVTKAPRGDIEQRSALRSARACSNVAPQRGAVKRVELGEPIWIIVCGGKDRQRSSSELIDELGAELLDARELPRLQRRFEARGVRKAAGRKCRIRELQHDPRRHRRVYNLTRR